MTRLDPPSGARLQVLSGPEDRTEWLEQLDTLHVRSAFALPGFAEFWAEGHPGSVAALLLWKDSSGSVLLPMVLRPLPERLNLGGDWVRDAVSPYGYGGPFGSGTPDWERFWTDVRRLLKNSGILTLTVRVSPGNGIETLPASATRVAGVTVVRRLPEGLSEDELWMGYRSKVRRNVRRAREDGLTFELDPECSRLDEFHAIYSATMERTRAADFYRFTRDQVERLVAGARPHCLLAHVLASNRVVSTEMVLLEEGRAYFFLGGTLESAFSSRPNDLLKHHLISWCRDEGRREYVLGGGLSDSAGIVRYKKAFAPEGVGDFHLACVVADDAEYARAVEAATVSESGFFPAYRSEEER